MSTKLSGILSLAGLALCAVLTIGFAAPVWAEKGDLESVHSVSSTISAPLTITLGKAEVAPMDGTVSDVLVADPNIIDVQAIQSDRLYIVGKTIGDTNVITLDAQGNVLKKLDVHVTYDMQAIQAMVNRLFPEESVTVGSVHDQIVLTGTASTPDVASKVTSVVGHYVAGLAGQKGTADQLVSNLMEVGGEQQVMLQVKIVEATRSVLKELGLNTNANDPNELSASTIFGGQPPSSVTLSKAGSLSLGTGGSTALTQDPAARVRSLIDTGIDGIGTLGLFIDALEQENLLNVLAEPNLTAVSGEQAGFLAGGEFPVPVGRDQVGNLVIEFRQFGVSLNFRPIVLSDKRISLQMNTEVSSLDFDSAVTLSEVSVPGLDVRRASTTVEIPSGGSLMIAGLLQSEAIKGMSGLPGIRKTPVLGDLISSDSFKRNETELVVIVTPVLVAPYADKKNAEEAPSEKVNPLATMFATNLRSKYELEDESVFAGAPKYGYLLN